MYCSIHEKRTLVASVDDFNQVSCGGCDAECNVRLDCGHICQSKCHYTSGDHPRIKCTRKCAKYHCLRCRKPCSKLCWEKCDPCCNCVRFFVLITILILIIYNFWCLILLKFWGWTSSWKSQIILIPRIFSKLSNS